MEDDLWLALQQQVDEEGVLSLPAKVKDIMDTWTLQMGFPLITVTRDYTSGGALVSQVYYLNRRDDCYTSDCNSCNAQDRFLIRKSANSTDTHIYRWWVPLSHTNGGNLLRKTEWISKDEASKTIANLGASSDNWVLFNYDQQS